jgi:hypothetical protein
MRRFAVKPSRKSTTAWWVLFTLVCAAVWPAAPGAATFLFSWNASGNLSVTAYGVYQKTGGSAFELVDEVRVEDLVDPANPSYLVTGLKDGTTYWFAASSILSTGAESDLFNQTCINVNGEVVECSEDEDTTASVYISCFISAAGDGSRTARPRRACGPAGAYCR